MNDSLQAKLVCVGYLEKPGVEGFQEDGELCVRGLGETCRTDEDELGLLLEVWHIAENVEGRLGAQIPGLDDCAMG